MSTARNKAIVRAFIEEAVVGFMQGDREDFRDFLAPDVVFHTPRLTSESDGAGGADGADRAGGADSLHAEVTAYAHLLADPNLIVDFVIAEDDFVAIHMTSGSHRSRPRTRPAGSLPTAGDPVDTGGMAILRVRDDKITDVWYYSKHPDRGATSASA
jgi:ketosteroid isomerase-like protein